MTTSTHTTDRLEGRGAMRTTWKRLGAVGLSLAALAAAVTTSALADTAKQRVVDATDHTALGNKPVQQITGISCLASAGGCDLYATTGTLTLPDGASYTIWGYGLAAAAATVPGPTIEAAKGDTLTIHLHNDLAVATSLSVAAVPVGDVAVASRNLQIAPASVADYTFTVKSSGTLSYEPGADAPTGPRQVAMGMAGTVVVRPTTCPTLSLGCAYGTDLPASQSTLDIYNDEALVAINDFDSRMLLSANPLSFLMADFSPDIHLINGKAFPDTQVIDALAGDSVLVRYANLSPIDRTMGVLGGQQKIIGRDAHPLAHTDVAVAPLFTPGQTAEAVVQVSPNAQPGDRFAVADQSRRMTRVNTGGLDKEIVGALTFIEVWKLTSDANQPVVGALALTGGTLAGTEDVTDGSVNLAFSFADTLGVTWRFFIDQLDNSGGTVLSSLTGAVTTAQLSSVGNGPHVIWVQSSLNGTTWGDASGIAFFLDRSGPVVHDTTVQPTAVNGDANHNMVAISSTGDTSLTGTQNVNAGFYTINPNAAATNCLAVQSGTALDADPAGPLPLAGLTQVQGFLTNADISALGEGGYNVSVIARDALSHFSSDPSGNPLCETANSGVDTLNRPYSFVVDKTGPVVSGGVANNFADPATTNGYTGYVANPNWEDAVYVQVQLSDLPSTNVHSNIALIEGFLEGSAGYTDATTGVNTPYSFVGQGGGVFEPQGPGTTGVNLDGTGIEFIASDGAFDGSTEKAYALVPLSTVRQLAAGGHRMFVHALDTAGNWGPAHVFTGSALEVGATITLAPDAPTITITSGSRTPVTGNRTQVSIGFMAVASGTQEITNMEWAPAAVGAVVPAAGWTPLNASATPPVAAPYFANEIANFTALVNPSQTVWIRVTDSNGGIAVLSIAPTASLGTLRATQLNSGPRTANVAVNSAAVNSQNITRIEWNWTQSAAPATWNNFAGPSANPRNVTLNVNMPGGVNSTLPSTFWVRVTDSLGTQIVLSKTVPGVAITTLTSTNITATTNRTVHAVVNGNGTPANVTAFGWRVLTGTTAPTTFTNVAAGSITPASGPNRIANFTTTAVPRTPRTFWTQVTDANGTVVILGQNLPAS